MATIKMSLVRTVLAAMFLAHAAGAAIAQSTVTLTAASATAVLPDGQSVPMWGYACGAVTGTGASCGAINGTGPGWTPPLIRVPAGQLTITLVNNLKVPTSIVIDGQLGGGLGNAPSRMVSPAHPAQGTTWPGSLGGTFGAVDAVTVSTAGTGYHVGDVVTISGGGGSGATAEVASVGAGGNITAVQVDSPGDAYTSAPSAAVTSGTGTGAVLAVSLAQQPTFQPPAQADRVRSFATEVAPAATNTALTWLNLRPGTYLLHSGTQPSIQHAMGLYGVLVVTEATPNTAYGTGFDTDVPLLFSEIDPDQNAAVATAVASPTFNERANYAGPGNCKDPDSGAVSATIACYPPAVNYSPRYYLINGTSFDRGNLAASTLPGPGAVATTGNVLLRIVNAGQRMHAPAVVGANMTPLAEDGNKVSKATGVQASIPMPPGKTFDAIIAPTRSGATAYAPATYAVYDRQLSLSTNNQRDGGMQAYIAVAGGATSGTGSAASAVLAKANPDAYKVVPGATLTVSDASKGLMANDIGVYGVRLDGAAPATGTLTLNANGTFTYASDASLAAPVTFNYCANNAPSGDANLCSTVTVSVAAAAAAPVAGPITFNSAIASRFTSAPPGLLSGVTNASGLVLTANPPAGVTNGTVTVNPDGSFVATPSCAAPCSLTFNYSVKNAQGTSSNTALATVNFVKGSGLSVAVKDGPTGGAISDYRWIIEEDRTFWIDPKCQVNSTDPAIRPSSCPPLPVESLGYNFHSSSMPVVASGCVGTVSCEVGQTLQGAPAACDVGNGVCRTDASQKTPVSPGDVLLDPKKRYFLSILPGDAINPTISGFGGTVKDCGAFSTDPNSATGPNWVLYDPASGTAGNCGHEQGGVQLPPGTTAATVNLQQIPLPTAKISVFVFQDDNPLNGENDAGGGVDVIAPTEAGLGGFEIKLFDQAGQLGDATGQITYDEFNMPVSNSLAGYIDPLTGLDACPITARTDTLVGMIPTCPKYESDGITPSPLAGQAVIANLYPGLYEIQAFPAADRIARGEQWLQTNTLDGGKPHEAFIIPNEPGYFQEFGPGGFHVAIGFANPAMINARKAGYCASSLNPGGAASCSNTLTVEVTNNHMSRTPDQRTYDSESYDHYSFTQCYVSIGVADAEDFALQPCVFTTDADGKTHATATFTGMPAGTFKLSVFDQWNDIMLDGLVGTVEIGAGGTTAKKFPVTQWRSNLYTRTYIDTDGSGVSSDAKPGLALVNTNIRYRDGSIGFFNNTDLNGYAAWNEVFPLMNWLVVETTQTRFKPTLTHSVYDAGGPVDCSSQAVPDATTGYTGCTTVAANLANTNVRVKLPTDLRVPGAKYCDTADCLPGDAGNGGSTGALFPPQAFGNTMGWQGLLGQNTFIEFGVKPFKKAAGTAPAENGGIQGQVIYASTRPFDDPSLLLQLSWEPGIPHATINLYRKDVDAQGNETLKLVDTTKSASWDDWAQGFRTGADGTSLLTAGSGANAGFVPNMNCPGQAGDSPFFATLKNSKMWLDTPDGSGNKKALAYQAQFKCYDGWSQLNQAQPAPYDGYYRFPSVTAMNPSTGKPAKTNCTSCVTNPDDGTPMLPSGTYVVEVIVPEGYQLVKEEDKNILMGDVMVAPVSQQFAGVSNIFIMPDQAAVNSAFNAASPGGLNKTVDLGSKTFPRHEGDTGSIEAFWPCVGAQRQVPDYMSEFPGSQQASPFAGAIRRLCDRKEIKLADEASVTAKFYLFSGPHIAGHFTGLITNDFASEFDPFSPQFGEKFGPPNLPVGLRDFNGNEVARVYADQWGVYNGLYFSTWSPNPPNPTGYAPMMSIACMNDPGPIMVNGVSMTDPSYNPAYSNFCYEQPFMPGTMTYMDTPVIPTQAFADNYNLPDTEYPNQTPAIKTVVNSSASEPQGPWVHSGAMAIRITALGDKTIQNPHFSGPNASTSPYNQKTITRHYGFGSSGTAVLVAPDGATTASLTITAWSDTAITATVPNNLSNAFNCKVQQHGTPPGQAAQCGQLVITRGDNGKRSIDAITVTVGGSAPWVVSQTAVTAPSGKSVKDYGAAFGRMSLTPGAVNQSPIQVAIDSASPGDLILVQPGTYRENLIMWKPVRLQGVGAAAATINADAHPAGHMDQWRRQMVCVFGLDLNGVPNIGNDPGKFDPTGQYLCPDDMFLTGDRIPFEAITGWQASGNGNLAQVLQEPTLLGAYEGAGITVVGRGVRAPANDPFFLGNDPTAAGAFPDGSIYLTDGSTALGNVPANSDDCVVHTGAVAKNGGNYGTSNYRCNPSRIDGLAVLNSSQGGGGIFIHGWNHSLDVANNRISANHGTLAGAVNVGNGETPGVYLNDGVICNTGLTPAPLCPPIYSSANTPNGAAIPFGFNTNVRVHHNMLWNNASIGDALWTGTPAGAGGVTVSAGGDGYSIDHNWIAGNLSTGDGGGIQSLGVTFNGRIANNAILFNQSTNPTLPTNGGGIVIQGANEPRTLNGNECGGASDTDCPPGLGDGTGPGLVIDANLIYGNSAESGTGGGIALEQINGSEVIAFQARPNLWYDVTVTNNIIANNVAGYDGGGVSMRDALKVSMINNTIASNDTTASAGVLFKTLGAINASNPPPGCNSQTDPSLPQDPSCLGRDAPHGPQPSGLVTMAHTQNLVSAIAALPSIAGQKMICPNGFGYANGTASTLVNADCMTFSRPAMVNDLFWQNRTFHVNIVGPGSGLISQQNLVVIAPGAASNNTPLAAQTASGQCPAGASYWDVGLRTDDVQAGLIGPTNNKLVITNSILTGTGDISNMNDVQASPTNRVGVANPVVAQICNGARVPPELCAGGGNTSLSGAATCLGYNAPVGASETTSTSQLFVFNSIQPTATVDEGHNWLNLVYGPLTLARPGVATATAGEQMLAVASTALDTGAYSIPGNSQAIGGGVGQAGNNHDFFGNSRATSGAIAIGAVERVASAPTYAVTLTPNPLAFGNWAAGTTSAVLNLTVANTGSNGLTNLTYTFGGGTPQPFSRVTTGTFPASAPNCGATLAVGAVCTVKVQFAPGTGTGGTSYTRTLTVASTTAGTLAPTVENLTGASVANRAAVTIAAPTITLASGVNTGTGTVTFANTAAAGGSQVSVTNVAATGGTALTYLFTNGTLAGPDNCTGVALAPGASCTVAVRFTNTGSARGTNRTGTITFTDTGTGSPQAATLTGFATP
ncbi:hypothetical protein HHL11_11930 [Ramlibacter sp. G-1-2-2]|uniref:RapA2 cadherin-like domain-containing protein n=1 Tax=Ramlibacter agri TaxID=2728837 RepID=A0A848H1M7_9BURK|nr:Ig-like domain-containing protein [Ramlibacter agri]NML44464.1 hypothetical protein [Ramlibacter agri]